MNECPIPEAALLDDSAVEMLRVWITEDDLHCSMKVGEYAEVMNITEESVWGTILADVARTLSEALEAECARYDGLSCRPSHPSNTLAKICDAFLTGLSASAANDPGIPSRHH
ncbi:DUF5076 domain-containing protein [Pandoraea pneumonica]|uniref:DUF5076 domain-containing protein n=1 Tax=Pandoraea pneumonica TaxID=2508299 RepID=UPI003CEF89F5